MIRFLNRDSGERFRIRQKYYVQTIENSLERILTEAAALLPNTFGLHERGKSYKRSRSCKLRSEAGVVFQ